MKIPFVCTASNGKRVALALLTGVLAGATAAAGPLSDSATAQIQALMAEKASFTAVQQKMDSQLVFALKKSRGQPIANGAVPQLRIGAQADAGGMVQVDINGQVTSGLLQLIQTSGGTVLNSSVQFNAIRASVPLTNIETIAASPDLKFVKPAVPYALNNSDPEGVAVHRADFARNSFNVDGSGVKVGVISDSVDFLAEAQALGDLGPVTVLPNQSGVPATGEGTAMLEIVHAMAPGAQLFFATANGGPANFANNILQLRNTYNCNIIVDDISYLDESPFQDATIALAVNQVTASGGLYFSSAANSGNLDSGTSGTWEGDFVNGGAVSPPVDTKGGFVHSFGTNNYDVVTQPGGAALLFWSDPLGGSTNDYDLYVLDDTGATVIGASTNPQNGSQDPFEGLVGGFTNGMRIVVVLASGTNRFLHFETSRGQLLVGTQGSTRGHNASTDAFGVAAVDVHTAYPNPFTGGAVNPVETFSSDGPRHIFFNPNGTPITPTNFLATGGRILQKPDIAAADGVTTSVPGFAPFYGTSAAAPHAAAIAALLLSYNPLLAETDVRALLTGTALDIMAPGVDRDSGFGIVMPYPALSAAPIPLVPRLVVQTNYVLGGNGNGIIDFNECNDLYLVLTNVGLLGATNLALTVASTNPAVFLPQPTVSYVNMPPGSAATNMLAIKLGTTPKFTCGTTISLALTFKFDGGTQTALLQLPTGTNGPPARFDSFFPVAIPDGSSAGTNSVNFVSGISGGINKVTVSLYITHPFDSDLTLELIGPDGTAAILADKNGVGGQNFGLGCFPDTSRTTFDDSAAIAITAGRPPFVGSFQPLQPLSIFTGKAGTNVNGLWQLHLVDSVPGGVGTNFCWSLSIASASCSDGGGLCPGVDLAIGMVGAPNPAIIGSNVVYTISVTNKGPNIARGAVVTHNLPASFQFVSASPSQGSASVAGNVVTATLGSLSVGGTAFVTVVGTPTLAGTFFSSANVASTDPELNPVDNFVSVSMVAVPPVADLTIGIADAPDPTVVGGPLTYTVSVTNNGPSTASGVFVTNTLPSSVLVQTVDYSQGSVSVAGNVVVHNVGLLPKNGTASATINVTPQAFGAITAVSTVSAVQPDPFLGNNTATAITSVGQSADLGVGLTARPNPVVLNSNLTYTLSVTNFGPNTATNVVASQTLPAGVTVVSTTVSQGTFALNGSTLTCNLGTLVIGARATVNVVVTTTRIGQLTSSATVSAAQADANVANNSATVTAQVAPPFISIASAGATLLSPSGGFMIEGVTNTLQLRLENLGNVPNSSLVATLLASGGVTFPSGSQNYGILRPLGLPGGAPVSRTFSFVPVGAGGGTVTATLQLQDASSNLPPVTFTFSLPSVATFANTNAITIPSIGIATNYPSIINVTGFTGQVGHVTASLNGFMHTFPHDVNVLLVGPTGVKTLLMSHAANQSTMDAPADVTFDDAAPAPLPSDGQVTPGSWQISDYPPSTVFSNPAPAGPYSTALADFNGLNANGAWSLFVLDDSSGDDGSIGNGWSLTFTAVTPVNQLADVGVMVAAAPNPVLVGDPLTYTFTVTNAGPSSATGVTFSNSLPVSVTLLSATCSQGNCVTNGNLVLGTLGNLATGAVVTVTIVVQPNSAGSLTNTASVAAFENDLHIGDNEVTVFSTANLPVADVSLGLSANPNPVILGSNLVYAITVTNNGPGNALDVVVTDPLPAGTAYASGTSSQGSVALNGGTVVASLGNLLPAATATVTLNITPLTAGLLTNTATVATASSDTNANNTVTSVVSAIRPAAVIVPAGALLVSESFPPANGVVDAGETVTVSLSLANTGVLNTTNLVAVLQQSGGVVSAPATNNYGQLLAGGVAVARPFTFTAGAPADGIITATLLLHDGSTSLGSVTFVFNEPAQASYVSTNAITIPDHGAGLPYPSAVTISGLTGVVSKVTVTLHGFTHSFPSDVSLLLANPNRSDVLLMSHAGGGFAVTNLTLTFDDASASAPPSNFQLLSGTNQPSHYGSPVGFPSPAPAAPYGASLATLNGADPNGTWTLYVLDDSAGDGGAIAAGWTLNITAVNPVNPIADLAVGGSTVSSSPYLGGTVTYSFGVTNLGPSAATSVVLSDALPVGFNVISNYSSQGSVSISAGVLTFNLGTLALNGTAKAAIVTSPTQPGAFLNTATLSGNCTDLNPANNIAQSSVTLTSPVAPTLAATYTGGLLHLTITAQPGLTYQIQASTNLTGWSAISTNVAPSNGTISYTDPNTAAFNTRFYRTVRVTP